ncbi:MAG: M42 family metallopeptidase [Chthonomonadales bacterium]
MNFDLLKVLCETPGISSREEPIRKVVVEAMKPLVKSITSDVMGNVIGFKPGSGGPKVMIAAHMDEIGFIVKFIDEDGFIRLQPIGGWDPRTMVAQRVYVHGFAGESLLGTLMPAAKPIHLITADEMKPPKVDEFFVDLGLTAAEVAKKVEIGDPVTMARTAELVGKAVVSKTLDDRVSVFVMLEALRKLGSHKCDVFAVATTQEEVGLRGAITSAYGIKPDIGIAVDITLANDFPGPQDHEQITRLGFGAAIKIMDSSLICHPKLVRHFRDVAEKNGIKYQMEILARGGTDAGGIQRMGGGVPSFTLSIPTRYVHTVNEMAYVEDIQACIDLLALYLEEAHTRDYGYSEDV